MAKFYMTDGEISQSYRQAKYPPGQIQVLADLNLVDRDAMELKLWELGLIERKPGKATRQTDRPPGKLRGRPPKDCAALSQNAKAKQARNRRDALKKAGKCIWCGQAAAEGKSLCPKCTEKSRAKASQARETKKKLTQAGQKSG